MILLKCADEVIDVSINTISIKRSMRGGKSITSGSPMSPGSFVSSESAGSSNSLDETDDNRIVTPIDDHMGPATIFEVYFLAVFDEFWLFLMSFWIFLIGFG